MTQDKINELRSVIQKFVADVNGNDKVYRLIRKWSSDVNVWAKDFGVGFILTVREGRVSAVKEAGSVDDGKVKVVGQSDTLIRMFRGQEKIARLYLDGMVETYGSERDQIVLDAVARLLWG
jgi:hypothetical protein